MSDADRRVYLREASEILDRRMGTIRKWESEGVLPPHLRPHREDTGRKWRYFTPDQIEQLKEWLAGRIPGSGLPTYDPDPDQVKRQIERMRGQRKVKDDA